MSQSRAASRRQRDVLYPQSSMKSFTRLALLLTLLPMLSAQTPLPGDRPGQTPAGQLRQATAGTNPVPAAAGNGAAGTVPAEKLLSAVYDWAKLTVIPTPKGVRRDVFDGPT